MKELCHDDQTEASMDKLSEKLLTVLAAMRPLDLSCDEHVDRQPEVTFQHYSIEELLTALRIETTKVSPEWGFTFK